MSESIQTILAHIKSHTDKEHELHVLNPSIGRCEFKYAIKNDSDLRWLVNRQYEAANEVGYNYDITGQIQGTQFTGKIDTYKDDGMYTSKNTELGRIMLYNSSGHHVCYMNGKRLEFDIQNSAHYIHLQDIISNIKIGIAGDNREYKYNLLSEAIANFDRLEELAKERQASIEEEERLRAESERRKKEQEAQYQRIKDEQERKRIEEQTHREEEERQASILAEQEKQRKIEEETRLKEQQIQELTDKYNNAVNFIRKQASLRINPRLDKHQDNVKFLHMYDGCVTIIDGGPGTGKTTTLIQRLRALISAYELRDYRENHPDLAKYTDKQIDTIIAKDSGNWIFFSPTELLRQYLRDNMNYEGLFQTEERTVVWEKYLRKILRDHYHLVGSDNEPFSFKTRDLTGTTLIKGDLSILEDFRLFYMAAVKEDLQKVVKRDSSHLSSSLGIAGKLIAQKCQTAQELTSITDIIRLMLQLSELKKQQVGGKTVQDLHKEYGDEISTVITLCLKKIEQDAELLKKVQVLLANWKNTTDVENEEIDDEDEDEQKTITSDWRVELPKRLKPLLRKLALQQLERQTIKDKQADLHALIKDKIDIDRLQRLGELALFNKYYYPVINNYEPYLFRRIPKAYRLFRKTELQNASTRWNLPLLTNIVKDWKNKPLHPDEQALLLGFINQIIITIAEKFKASFEDMSHNYAKAYKDLCRPVIGIDEATDYNLFDYYAIYSLRHYEISSITLTGDIMQCLKSNGIMHWSDLQRQYLFPKIDVQQLSTSYRQSPKLLTLAKQLYQDTVHKEAPYVCFMDEEEDIPSPLWYSSDIEQEKAHWIIKRILEVKNNYQFVPSIAIFAASKEEAALLKANMDFWGELDDAGIEVKDCSLGDTLADKDMVRIFPIDQVKGMEFEVVFFHNIDKVQKMVTNYLYVGLSRATFYLGVTSQKSIHNVLGASINSFATNGNWIVGKKDDFISEEGLTNNVKPNNIGHCIRCGETIPYAYKELKPRYYCKDCWRLWRNSGEDKDEKNKYCHRCGQPIGNVSFNKPLCYNCWKEEEK